jgi:hypothetical protein
VFVQRGGVTWMKTPLAAEGWAPIRAPGLGEQTREILAEAGFEGEELNTLSRYQV